MAGSGRKIFTAGDVLTASDVQNYLMDQTVMNFAGTAARSSAVATPTTGMVSYIGTTGTATIPQLETYTGSAWQTPYGITELANVAVTASTGATINNVFSSTYDAYKLIITGTSASGQLNVFYQNTLAGTPASGSNTYKYGSFYVAQTLNAYGSNFYSAGNTSAIIGQFTATANTADVWTFDITNPATTKFTNGAGLGGYGGTGTFAAFQHAVATAYDGCKIFCDTNWTGTIRIYGYRNS